MKIVSGGGQPRRPFGFGSTYGRPMRSRMFEPSYGRGGFYRPVGAVPKVMGVVFLVIGLILGGFGGYLFYKNTTTQWATVTAKVTDSVVVESFSDKGNLLWQPILKYTFAYSGKEYTDSYSGIKSSDYGGAVRLAERYDVGNDLELNLNPSDPYDNYPKSESGAENFVPMILGIIGIVFAAIGLFVMLSKPAEGAPQPQEPQVMQ